ncbi:MAG: acetyl-CoA hydrolase/transferase C-terminal domain-containing protein [Eubacteriales bacterium]|nr:acetyl-CoA hydrolase/transferase C-terminal domain-containing protein [Eubacteriales bacterium]
MDWKSYYQKRCVDAGTALKNIKSNSRIVFGHCIGEPMALVNTLVANKDWFSDIEIVHMVAMGKGEYTKPEMTGHFRHNSVFVGTCTRDAVKDGRADFTPCFFSELPALFRSDGFKIDVAMVQVAPPDEFGYVNLGVSVDYTVAAIEQADMVIAQVNENMPRTFGDAFVHVSEIDWFVEITEPLVELRPAVISDVEKKIGEYCASLIEDGSTLQLGIGSIPDAILLFLKNKKDLGIHSEMLSDGVVGLIEEGIVNNSQKTMHKGKSVVSFLMGTKRLYDFVDCNPSIEMHPVDYVNNPTVIMRNYRMVSINSCVQVDLMGQVASESVGLKQISAVGGQVDFVRGANMARDGKSIIAIPATVDNGRFSKIVPFLDKGAAVTTSRNDVNYIVTEYGIAHLRGKTLRERSRLLINIAHPDFRPMLIEEHEKRFNQKF